MSWSPFVFVADNLQAALAGSLLTVWVLVGLFFYLNHYTKRRYFAIWTAAWLFYALWLTLTLISPAPAVQSAWFVFQQWAMAISAVCLFWGSVACLGLPVRDALIGLFALFLLLWSYASRWYLDRAVLVQVPIFALTGLTSIFVGCAFYHMRYRQKFVGAGLLFFGFVLWGVFLISFPLSQQYAHMISAAFALSMILQLFIAVAMIVLVLEEARENTIQVRSEIESIKAENRALQMRMLRGDAESGLLANQHLPQDLREAYEELRRTQYLVVRQERLRALGEMASGIAHDINNALCPVVAFSQILAEQPGLSEDSRRQLGHIRTAGEDIARIVGRMREFYRQRTALDSLTDIEVGPLLEEVVELTRPKWRDLAQRNGTRIELKTRVEGALPPLHSEASEMREALTNLVINAVDAMPHGGTITLSAHVKQTGHAPDVQEMLVLEVQDTGMGMTDEVKKRCLEPFFSTKHHHGGSGLGLAMVYGITERHSGSIEIDTEPGKGTSVRLCFPIGPKAVPLTLSTESTTERLRILCIDDEPMLRELMHEILHRGGHEVSLANGGRDGIDTFTDATREKRPFDAVITDLGMPDVDGLQVAREIKKTSPATPVLLLTGWGTLLGEDAAEAATFDVILSKPPRIPELMAALARTTNGARAAARLSRVCEGGP